MRRLFQHTKLSVPKVTIVRVDGNLAVAVWGSRTMRAGYMTLQRERDRWAITEPIGSTLL
jgi:hypothetical protein